MAAQSRFGSPKVSRPFFPIIVSPEFTAFTECMFSSEVTVERMTTSYLLSANRNSHAWAMSI